MGITDPHTGLRQLLIRGGAWTLFGRLLSAVLGLAMNALLARALAPAQLGQYILYASGISLLALLSASGVDGSVISLVAGAVGAGDPAKARGTIRTCLRWGLIGGLIVGVVMTLILLFGFAERLYPKASGTPLMIWLVIPWLISATVLGISAGGLRALHQGAAANLISGPLVSGAVCLILVSAILGHFDISVFGVTAISACASVVAACVAFLLLSRAARRLGSAEPMAGGALLRYSAPFLVNGAAIFFASQADVWVAATILGSQGVAIYAASSRLVQFVLMPTLIGNLVIAPFASQLVASRDLLRLERIARGLADLTLAPAVLSYLAIVAFAPTLLVLVFGEAYRGAAPALIILCTGQVLNIAAGPAATVLAMTGHQSGAMWMSLASGLLIIALSILLAPVWGVSGIATAVATSTALHGLGSWYLVRRYLSIRTHANGSSMKLAAEWFPRWQARPPR